METMVLVLLIDMRRIAIRDVQRRNGVSTLSSKYDGYFPCADPPERLLWTGEYLSYHAARSEISQSDGIIPTAYLAFRSKKQAHEYEYFKTRPSSCRFNNAYHYASLGYYGTSVVGNFNHILVGTGDVYSPVVPNKLVTTAENRLLAKLTKSKVDMGQVLGELVKEAGQLTKLMTKIGKILLAIRRKQYKQALRLAKLQPGKRVDGASEAYLAWMFGLRPLVQTAVNLHSGIHEALNKDKLLVSARGYCDETVTSFNTASHYGEGSVKRGALAGATYQMNDSFLASLSQLGLVNPLATAWQLTTLSFVIDWFFSVGAFLEGFSAPLGYTYHSGFTTEFADGSITYTDRKSTAFDFRGKTYFGTFPGFTITEFGMKRGVNLSFPKPGLVFSVDLNLNQLVTIMALLRTSR